MGLPRMSPHEGFRNRQSIRQTKGKPLIDHVSIGVADLDRSAAFYEAVLGTLGMVPLARRPATLGFGKRYPEVWLNHRPGLTPHGAGNGTHICLRARNEEAVAAFHAAALAHGGTCDGAPGPRQGAATDYYAAFIRDPDDNRIEAATFPPAPSTLPGGKAAGV